MASRLSLQTLLENILGSRNVYFQPPESVRLSYPCIIYKRNSIEGDFADNLLYSHMVRYQITLIDPNPDSQLVEQLAILPRCKHDRYYTSDNLNHDVYNIYY